MIPVAYYDQSTARTEHSESFLDSFARSSHERGAGPTVDRSTSYGIDYTSPNIQQAVAPKAPIDGYSNNAHVSQANPQNRNHSTGLATTANRGFQNHLASDSGNLNQGSTATYRWEYAYSANGSYHYSLRLNADANTGQNNTSYPYIRPENRQQTSDVEFAPTYRTKDKVYYTLKAANPTHSLGFTNDAKQASTSYHAAEPVCEVDNFAAPRAAAGGHGVPSNPTAAYTTASADSGKHKFNLDDPALDWGAIDAFIARHGLEPVTSSTEGAMGEYSAAPTGCTKPPFEEPRAWGNSQHPLAVNNATPHHSAYLVQYSPGPANVSAGPSPADSIFSRGTNATQATTPAASPLVPAEIGNGSSVEMQQATITSNGEQQQGKGTGKTKGKGTKAKGATGTATKSVPKRKRKGKASGHANESSSTSKAVSVEASGSATRVSKAIVPSPLPMASTGSLPSDTVTSNLDDPSSPFTFTIPTGDSTLWTPSTHIPQSYSPAVPEASASSKSSSHATTSANEAPPQSLLHSFSATSKVQADWTVQVAYNPSPPRGDKAVKMNTRRLAKLNFQMINPSQ